jgi:ammonium transporter, Amt family
LLAWLGWCGLNGAGAILFAGTGPAAIARVSINVTLAAAGAGLAAAWLTRTRFGKPDASLTANAWVAGMVAVSASSPFIMPAASVVIGAVAGVLVVFGAEWLELKAKVDDPGGSVSVHALAGIWGLLALPVVALFPRLMLYWGNTSPISYKGQWLAQLVGIASLLGCVLPMTYFLNWLLNRIYPYRVSEEGERHGMDLQELGAGAYPEFMTHTDDFLER